MCKDFHLEELSEIKAVTHQCQTLKLRDTVLEPFIVKLNGVRVR